MTTTGDTTIVDLGEFKSPVASRKNPDGTASFITTAPGFMGVDVVVGSAAGKRTLIVRSAQRDHVFTEGRGFAGPITRSSGRSYDRAVKRYSENWR